MNLQREKKNPLSKTKQDPCKPYHVSDHLILWPYLITLKGCLPVQTNKTTNEIHPNLPQQQVLLKLKWYMPIHESHPKASSQKKQVFLINKSRYPRSRTDSKQHYSNSSNSLLKDNLHLWWVSKQNQYCEGWNPWTR